METKIVIKQTLLHKVTSEREIAEKYYSLLSVVNNLGLAKSEIQLVAFTAIKGNITYANVRKEFCTTYNTTSATINNIVSKLKKKKIFLKKGKIIYVNPIITIDFKKDLHLEINFQHETK